VISPAKRQPSVDCVPAGYPHGPPFPRPPLPAGITVIPGTGAKVTVPALPLSTHLGTVAIAT